jgi:hypothetical protein
MHFELGLGVHLKRIVLRIRIDQAQAAIIANVDENRTWGRSPCILAVAACVTPLLTVALNRVVLADDPAERGAPLGGSGKLDVLQREQTLRAAVRDDLAGQRFWSKEVGRVEWGKASMTERKHS